MVKYLLEPEMGERDIYANHGDQTVATTFLVVIYALPVIENLLDSLDEGNKLGEVRTE